MRKSCLRFLLALTFLALSAFYADAYFFTSFCVVTGTITYQGHPAEKGQAVTAFIQEDKVAEALTQENGLFELKIPEYDPAKPDLKGFHSANDIIQVKLAGKNARPTFSPTNENLKLDLRVEQTLDVKLSTWGKIKALFK